VVFITSAAKRMLQDLLERRSGGRRSRDAQERPAGAPGRFLRLHPVSRTGLLGVALDRPRPGDHTLDIGGGEVLLVDDGLGEAIEGFVLDADEGGSLCLQAASSRPRPAAGAPDRPGREVRGRGAHRRPGRREPVADEGLG